MKNVLRKKIENDDAGGGQIFFGMLRARFYYFGGGVWYVREGQIFLPPPPGFTLAPPVAAPAPALQPWPPYYKILATGQNPCIFELV